MMIYMKIQDLMFYHGLEKLIPLLGVADVINEWKVRKKGIKQLDAGTKFGIGCTININYDLYLVQPTDNINKCFVN